MHWKCLNEQGEVLESSKASDEPTTFEVGAGDIVGNQLFEAFDEAVRGLAVNETIGIKVCFFLACLCLVLFLLIMQVSFFFCWLYPCFNFLIFIICRRKVVIGKKNCCFKCQGIMKRFKGWKEGIKSKNTYIYLHFLILFAAHILTLNRYWLLAVREVYRKAL